MGVAVNFKFVKETLLLFCFCNILVVLVCKASWWYCNYWSITAGSLQVVSNSGCFQIQAATFLSVWLFFFMFYGLLESLLRPKWLWLSLLGNFAWIYYGYWFKTLVRDIGPWKLKDTQDMCIVILNLQLGRVLDFTICSIFLFEMFPLQRVNILYI